MNDEEAVRRYQDGNREAFRHLVERYKDVLYGTAYLMTGNASIAEDQVQEALLSAWRGIGGFRNGRPVKPWLVRILVNSVMSQRRRRSIPTAPLEEAAHRPDAGDTADHEIEQRLQGYFEAESPRLRVPSGLWARIRERLSQLSDPGTVPAWQRILAPRRWGLRHAFATTMALLIAVSGTWLVTAAPWEGSPSDRELRGLLPVPTDTP